MPAQGADPVPVAACAAAFTLAACTSLAFTYLVRRRACAAGLFDWPRPVDVRRMRARYEAPRAGIPRVGGVAVLGAVLTTIAAVGPLWTGTHEAGLRSHGLLTLLAGGIAMHAIGLVDDLRPLRARWKFVGQIIVALAVCGAGVRLGSIALPMIGVVTPGPLASTAITTLWLVAVTNAINLIDGLDGLAAGAAMFALVALFSFAQANGRWDAALVSIALAGAAFGFLRFNFYPATIFLGDSGSLFIGFMLGGVGVLSTQRGAPTTPTGMTGAALVVVLGLPLLDVALAVMRRLSRGQPIFAPDRAHIHHRILDQLLARGHSPRAAVLTLYALCAICMVCGMALWR